MGVNMPLGHRPIDTAFPDHPGRTALEMIIAAVPSARDTSHPLDQYPSISVPGATVWVLHYWMDDDPDAELEGEWSTILVEFERSEDNPLGAFLRSNDVVFVIRMLKLYSLSIACMKASKSQSRACSKENEMLQYEFARVDAA